LALEIWERIARADLKRWIEGAVVFKGDEDFDLCRIGLRRRRLGEAGMRQDGKHSGRDQGNQTGQLRGKESHGSKILKRDLRLPRCIVRNAGRRDVIVTLSGCNGFESVVEEPRSLVVSGESDGAGRLSGKVALITGAGRGIGRGIALRFAQEGARLALVARTESEIDAVAAEIASADGGALAIVADVTSEEAVRAAVDRTLERFGPIDILVNSAGVYHVAHFLEHDLDRWKQVFEVNVHGSFIACQAVLPSMIERGSGRIIQIASTAGKWGTRYQSAYNASKHAVLGLTKCLALEMAEAGIRVNAICPAFVEGSMVNEQLPNLARILGGDADDARSALLGRIPIGRFIRLDEIPPLAVYLASDESEGMRWRTIYGRSSRWRR
jgi:NAD(P)-dependent dehydrogenase (short-subunit alcohol dehydrogenase family)